MRPPEPGVVSAQSTQMEEDGDPQVKTGTLWLELRPGGKALTLHRSFRRAGTLCLLRPRGLEHIR